jgi:hypothetical protein
MKLLKELSNLYEKSEKASVNKNVAAKVYHRDYVKTKTRKYRKYKPEENK